MTKQEFQQLVRDKIVILDGATGSNLQKAGMKPGCCPETWMLENKESVISLQEAYLEAGTDIVFAPTFTSNRVKLAEYGLEGQIEEINAALVSLSREAIARYQKKHKSDKMLYVAGDITMTGVSLEPYGPMRFEELITIYKEQMRCLVKAGVDLFVVETMLSLQECRAALIAAKEVSDVPVMISMTFNEDGRTLYGTDPKTAIIVLQSLGADAVGANCSTGPKAMCAVLDEMKQYAKIPLLAKPNAGLPKLVKEETVFSMDAAEFAAECTHFLELGVNLIGGCCGTTPEHIKLLRDNSAGYQVPAVGNASYHAVTTERNTVEFGLDGHFMVVGERINPTGKKALQAELKNGVLDMVSDMAQKQSEAGADLLDINMGMNGIDEKEMMLKVIQEVTQLVSTPLCIDSSHIEVIEAALRAYPGRALINSISLETEKFEKLLPIAKKYGAMFILLPLSDAGLPKDIEEKKQIIHTIMDRAISLGLEKEDIIVDGLVNTIGANKMASLQTIETIRYCKEELGLATIVGLSNISFGLPERQFVNSTFLAFAISAGLTMAIANPEQDLLMNTAYAADLLRNKEEADMRYIERVTAHPMIVAPKSGDTSNKAGDIQSFKDTVQDTNAASAAGMKEAAGTKDGKDSEVYTAVIKGNRRKILEFVKEELQNSHSASDILNQMLIPAITKVGSYFEAGTYFLPQLIASAEAMKTAIDYLEPLLAKDSSNKKAGTIVIATVAGDIHDIGKNLVALMLKNYGFEVIDLGKDVAAETIIETAHKMDADIIALSALMTTTMLEMKKVIALKNQSGIRAKVMIGGAVITQSYCDEIGADGYSKDAQEAVTLVRRLLNM